MSEFATKIRKITKNGAKIQKLVPNLDFVMRQKLTIFPTVAGSGWFFEPLSFNWRTKENPTFKTPKNILINFPLSAKRYSIIELTKNARTIKTLLPISQER